MQHSLLYFLPSWRTPISILPRFSICLTVVLLVTNTLAVSLPTRTEAHIHPAISIPRTLLLPRAQGVNLTEAYIQACGLDFVDCGAALQYCCPGGQECFKGTESGTLVCRGRPGVTSSPSPLPDNGGSKTPIGAIVGGVLGAVAIIAILCILYLVYRRRHPPTTPAIPQAPVPNLPNVIEAKYPPANETSYSGDHWQPGSFLFHNRNRSVSTGSAGCISPDGSVPACDTNISKYQHPETHNIIMELPAVSPTVELQGDDGYFASKPYVPPPPVTDIPPNAPLSRSTTVVSPMSPRRLSTHKMGEIKNYWRKSRGT